MIRLLPLLLLALASCSVQAKVTLSDGGAASIQAEMQLAPASRDAWNSLRELDGSLPRDPLDATLWSQTLGSRGRVSTAGLNSSVTLELPSLAEYLPSWKQKGEVWEATLDRASVRRWASLTSWADSPALDSLIPAPGAKVSEKDYRDLLLYLLGPGTPAEALDRSEFRLTVVTPRPLKSAPGALTVSDRTATYRWPLARVLSLETPITIKLQF